MLPPTVSIYLPSSPQQQYSPPSSPSHSNLNFPIIPVLTISQHVHHASFFIYLITIRSVYMCFHPCSAQSWSANHTLTSLSSLLAAVACPPSPTAISAGAIAGIAVAIVGALVLGIIIGGVAVCLTAPKILDRCLKWQVHR